MLDRRQLIFLAGGALVASKTGALAQIAPTPQNVFNDPEIPVLGNPDGDVTIVEFYDYQCPFCKRGHPDLVNVVESDGNIRLLMRDWPIFGEPSRYASNLTLSLRKDLARYEAAHGAIMATTGRLASEQIDDLLLEAGFDPDELAAAYESDKLVIDAIISRNNGLAEGFGLGGTPTFVIGRKVYGGALDAQGLRQAVVEAREA